MASEEETPYLVGLQQARQGLSEAKAELRDEAQPWLDAFWESHWMTKKEYSDYRDWSILGVRARQRGDDFYLQWFWNKWITTKEKNKIPISTYIRKGRGYQYPDSRLIRYARSWEMDLVLQVEQALAGIRKRQAQLKRAEKAINQLIKEQEQQEGGLDGALEADAQDEGSDTGRSGS